jgi:hypothetical protein
MAQYFMAQIDNGLFRLRIVLNNEVAQFSFMYYEKNYKILTYAFFDKDSNQDAITQKNVKWQPVDKEKALPIVEMGMQKYRDMMTAFDKEPNF